MGKKFSLNLTSAIERNIAGNFGGEKQLFCIDAFKTFSSPMNIRSGKDWKDALCD
jgi:hypothetical protein